MRYKISAFCLIAIFVCQFSGCTLVFYGAGAISDSTKPDHIIFSGEKKWTIRRGTKIDILLKSGEKLEGKIFLELAPVPAEEYAKRYAKSQEHNRNEIILPTLGEPITVTTESGQKYECDFFGFDYGTILIRQTGSQTPRKVNIEKARWDNIVDSRGNLIEVETIRHAMSEAKVPFLSTIVFFDETNRIPVDVREGVIKIQVPAKKRSKTYGLIAGAIIDLIIIAVLATSPWELKFNPHIYESRDPNFQ